MKKLVSQFVFIGFVLVVTAMLCGCTIIFQKGRRSDVEKINALSSELDELNAARNLLAERLKQEISDKEVRLDMAEKGLVITFVADVLFDSGKAKVKERSYSTLDKVARVLSENLPAYNIGIEGHTDNEPIKHSGWPSNWELSTARALSVLHYLVDEKGISGHKVSAIGYGEYQSVASNDTKDGMQLNRRVEIVVLPKVSKVKGGEETPKYKDPILKEPAANLK